MGVILKRFRVLNGTFRPADTICLFETRLNGSSVGSKEADVTFILLCFSLEKSENIRTLHSKTIQSLIASYILFGKGINM